MESFKNLHLMIIAMMSIIIMVSLYTCAKYLKMIAKKESVVIEHSTCERNFKYLSLKEYEAADNIWFHKGDIIYPSAPGKLTINDSEDTVIVMDAHFLNHQVILNTNSLDPDDYYEILNEATIPITDYLDVLRMK